MTYDTKVFATDARCDADILALALTDPALGILRAKGFVRDLQGRRITIQIVGARHQTSPAPSDSITQNGVVAIGLKGRIDLATIAVRIAEASAPTPPSPSAA